MDLPEKSAYFTIQQMMNYHEAPIVIIKAIGAFVIKYGRGKKADINSIYDEREDQCLWVGLGASAILMLLLVIFVASV